MTATAARERVIADSQFGAGAITGVAPATWYVGLSTTIPANDGSGFSEPVGAAYGRVAFTNNATNWPAASTSDGVTRKLNGAKITFPNPTGAWGTIVYWGLFLNPTGGTPEWVGALSAPIAPRNGNSPVEFDLQQLELIFS